MKKLLVVIDMQNDFITGQLGSEEARAIVPAVVKKVEDAIAQGTEVIFTQDTHGENYLNTQEGKHLPLKHCIKGTEGWKLISELEPFAQGRTIVEKPSFGSLELGRIAAEGGYEDIQLVGVCTDICVISNAMVLKAAVPEVPISVDELCCAGVSVASHEDALDAMRMCQIAVI